MAAIMLTDHTACRFNVDIRSKWPHVLLQLLVPCFSWQLVCYFN